MNKLRMRFSKTARAVYISHLDLMHTMQRAFSRAGIELAYSEGFNPHPALSMALPLSVGMESICEIMDFKVKEDVNVSLDSLICRLNSALPEGITINEIYPPDRKISEIKYLKIQGDFEYGMPDAPDITSFFSRDSIVISKRTKKGIAEFDLKPHIKSIELEIDGSSVHIISVICAQEPTVNPDLLADALRQLCPEMSPDFCRYRRIETFDCDMRIFR